MAYRRQLLQVFEAYSIVAYVYLVLTIGLSLILRQIEKKMRETQAKA